MSGPHVDHLLLALVERRLAPPERARALAHLGACQRCRRAAEDLAETAGMLRTLPGALRALPLRLDQRWPEVWRRAGLAAPRARRMPGPRASVYLSLASTCLAFLAVLPAAGRSAPARVTAGVALGPHLTQPATLAAYHTAAIAHTVPVEALPTLAGTAAAQPLPIPTPVPGP